MDAEKDLNIDRLLNMKLQSVTELSKIMKDWGASADYENEDTFSANLEKRQELINKIILVNGELSNVVHSAEFSKSRYSLSNVELIRKTNEILQQIQVINDRDIFQVKSNMDFFRNEAKRYRQGKSRLAVYMRNELPARSKQYDLRG